MSNETETDYVVIQQGGSSFEYYTTIYVSKEAAFTAIKSHKEASYDAVGPFPIPHFPDDQLPALIEAFDLAAKAVSELMSLRVRG